ncbi:acyltransferase [Chitinibacter bivalviorum]|uniref:Acyltransferase n=1 Tax=Chitinibacter bivalviorum TaxID=2739434 RepID=A0A7H9BLY3_9NEIS|nr:acyltransferase [Chitinibacter bivalviorum]QLG89690.1 acyltransferase [Chitinibacter bivalviorum]
MSEVINPHAPIASAQHIAVVDGLRGLAILLVILFHYWQITWWVIPIPLTGGQLNFEFIQHAGALGVELFFFLSAFCLTYPHAKFMQQGGSLPTLAHYTYRRAIKILPSYWLAMLLLLLLWPDMYPTSAQRGYWTDILMHLGFVHNLFGDTHGSINGVFWSLGVEVQFYVFFPLLAWAFRRKPWWVFGAMCAVAMLYRHWTRTLPVSEFVHLNNQLPGFLDLFASGMLSAYLLVWVRAQRETLVAQLKAGMSTIVVLAVLSLLLLFNQLYQVRFEANAYPYWQSLHREYLSFIFISLTVATTFAHSACRAVLANRVLVFLSLISYNLYLWHQVVARIIKEHGWWTAATPVPTDDPTWQWTMFLLSLLVSVAMASLITYGFERPLLQHGVKGCWQRAKASWHGYMSKDQ